MFEAVKYGLGEYLQGFYNGLVSTTKPMDEFITRGFSKSVALADSTLVDEAENILQAWQRNDTDTSDTRPAKLPVIIAAVDRDYVPTSREYNRQIADSMQVIMPGDSKERCFGLRVITGDIRAQLVIIAAQEPTAKSIASQFLLYLDAVPNRRFHVAVSFAGVTEDWPVQIETPDVPAMAVKVDIKNVCMLTIDLTLRAEIPLYDAPKAGEYNDGKGTPGTDDPAGYPLVVIVNDYPNFSQ